MSVRDAYSHPFCSTCSESRSCKKHSITHPSPLVNICNLRFADDIDLMGGSSGELQDLTNRLVNRSTIYGMEVSTEKSKIMTDSTHNVSADISINGQNLEVTSFKYLGVTLCKEGTCSAEVCIRVASAMAAMARLNRIWRCSTNQLRMQVQALLVSCHLHPPLWL